MPPKQACQHAFKTQKQSMSGLYNNSRIMNDVGAFRFSALLALAPLEIISTSNSIGSSNAELNVQEMGFAYKTALVSAESFDTSQDDRCARDSSMPKSPERPEAFKNRVDKEVHCASKHHETVKYKLERKRHERKPQVVALVSNMRANFYRSKAHLNPQVPKLSNTQYNKFESNSPPEDCSNQIELSSTSKKPAVTPWMIRYKELVTFKQETGHCHVPQRYHGNRKLGQWVRNQRARYKANQLREDQIQKLDDIEFCWVIKRAEDPFATHFMSL